LVTRLDAVGLHGSARGHCTSVGTPEVRRELGANLIAGSAANDDRGLPEFWEVTLTAGKKRKTSGRREPARGLFVVSIVVRGLWPRHQGGRDCWSSLRSDGRCHCPRAHGFRRNGAAPHAAWPH